MKPYDLRIEALSKKIAASKADLFLVEDSVNLFYLTGLKLSCGQLLVDSNGGAFLLVDGRYYETCQKDSPIPVSLLTGKDSLQKFLTNHPYKSLGFSKESTTYSQYEYLKTLSLTLVPMESQTFLLRQIKGKDEIEALQKAALLGTKGCQFVVEHLKEGVTERTLAKLLEMFWLAHGGEGLAFEPIIAFGANTSMPHYHSSDVPLKTGDPVLIDIGVRVGGYCSDMTRVHFFGEVDPKIQEIYKIVEEAKAKALEKCHPGISIEQVDKAARAHIAAAGYGEYFTHGLGHGVGLEVHEGPSLSQKSPDRERPLAPGMVITIEPGIYLPGIGGVRLEDTIVIDKNGYTNFYSDK